LTELPHPELVEQHAIGVGVGLIVADSLGDEVERLVGDQRDDWRAVDDRVVDLRPEVIGGVAP
jgi:hypothetical protein